MRKRRKPRRMAGPRDAEIKFRLPHAQKKRFEAALSMGMGELTKTTALCEFVEAFAQFTEAKKVRPATFAELCAWVVSRKS